MTKNEELGIYIDKALKLIGSQLIFDFGKSYEYEYIGANAETLLKKMNDFKMIIDFLIESIELKRKEMALE